ncbi:MAG: hypothetical protein E6J90_09430 [Deltaproteobacteria bacterium]|nr:MAG: hypothetical protein E6J90_09430 [Deltaproteobacteria bacterium]
MAIRCDEQGFETNSHRIRWDELLAVGIRTTADGPFLEDVFWQFLLPRGALELPGSLVTSTMLGVMQRSLPGIDSRKIIVAMGSTEERIFRVWHAAAASSPRDDAALGTRFAALVGRLGGLAPRADDVVPPLLAAWSAGGRRYHDREHLAECLHELDGARAEPGIADIAELALWYHDAIYEPGSPDCEARSADWLLRDATLQAIPHDRALAAAACVRATAHLAGAAPSGPASELVVDIDLAILGRDVLRFMEFEYAIEEEYGGKRGAWYFLARGRFLAAVLASPAIFRTDHFREHYEQRARDNIAALLASPRYRAHRWFGRVARCFL